MRFYEVLVEYKTDITKSRYGEKILDVLNVQDALDGLYQDSGRIPEPGTTKGWTPRQQDREVHSLRQLGDYKELILNVMGVAPWNRNGTERVVDQELYDEHKSEMIEALLKVFESFDPTRNKQYMRYIIKWFLYANWGNETEFPRIEDGRSTLNQAFDDFYRMKARIPEKYRDIAQYNDAGHFVDSVQELQQKYGKKKEVPKGTKELIYTSDFVDVYWPIDRQAACYLGQGTQWCTSATKSTNYFNQYNRTGPIPIFNFKKPINGVSKIQGNMKVDGDHWRMNYFANEKDRRIDFDTLYDDENFHAMWNDLKFQSALGKMAKDWLNLSDDRPDYVRESLMDQK